MKKVLIMDGTGSLVTVIIEELKMQKDVKLTLFARSRKGIFNIGDAHVIEGNVTNYGDVKKAVIGQDIVYVNLEDNLDVMAKNIIKAMQEENVKRIIAISSVGIFDQALKATPKSYRSLSDNLKASGLDYTILRPNWLTNVNELDHTNSTKSGPGIDGRLSRINLAYFIVKLIENSDLNLKLIS